MRWQVVHCFTPCVIWKSLRWTYNIILQLGNLYFTNSNIAEAIKSLCCAKGDGAVDHTTLTRGSKKFRLGYKNLTNQAKSGKLKTIYSKAVLLAVETNPVSNTRGVSGELGISQFSVVHYLHDLRKIIRSFRIVSHITKIWQNCWFARYQKTDISMVE